MNLWLTIKFMKNNLKGIFLNIYNLYNKYLIYGRFGFISIYICNADLSTLSCYNELRNVKTMALTPLIYRPLVVRVIHPSLRTMRSRVHTISISISMPHILKCRLYNLVSGSHIVEAFNLSLI